MTGRMWRRKSALQMRCRIDGHGVGLLATPSLAHAAKQGKGNETAS